MSTLTRRCQHGVHQETWHIYYGDVRIGSLGERPGVRAARRMALELRLLSGMDPSRQQRGIVATFEEPRAGLESAWAARACPG